MLTDALLDPMLDFAGALVGFAAINTADGEADVPRQRVTWQKARNGTVASNGLEFPVPAGAYTSISMWSDPMAGTLLGSLPLTDGDFEVAGVYRAVIVLGPLNEAPDADQA